MPSRNYVDLQIELSDLDDRSAQFRVLLTSPLGEMQQPAVVPYNAAELQGPLDDLDAKRISTGDLIDLGTKLGNAMLPPGQARDIYLSARRQLAQDGGVRLRLVIREPRLAQLPWEYAYLQFVDGPPDLRYFLALDPQVSIVRHEPLPLAHTPLAGPRPTTLRMVAATSSPAGFPELKLDLERQAIQGAVGDLDVDGLKVALAPFLVDATYAGLAAALEKGCEFFHFAGHGAFQESVDVATGQPVGSGCIVLEKDGQTHEPDLVGAADIARLLQAAGVRVAVLGACESARVDGQSPWNGVAPAVVETGVPAVIAMQYEVVDTAALAFSRQFYTALAAGLSVDEAVWAGRNAMLRVDLDDNAEWGVPVLYMRSPDGILFPALSQAEPPTAIEIRKTFVQTIQELDNSRAVALKAKKVGTGTSVEVRQDIGSVKNGAEAIGAEIDEL